MDTKTLAAATGLSLEEAGRWIGPINQAAKMFEINTPQRQAHFIAQIAHESNSFASLVESLNYSAHGLAATWPTRFAGPGGPNSRAQELGRHAGEKPLSVDRQKRIAQEVYGGRMGNYTPDDAWNYRGRGIIQLTGRANYESAASATGLDLVQHPELLERPEAAALVAAWYWKRHGLNEKADAGKLSAKENIVQLRLITKAINGGLVGIEDRTYRLSLASAALMV